MPGLRKGRGRPILGCRFLADFRGKAAIVGSKGLAS